MSFKRLWLPSGNDIMNEKQHILTVRLYSFKRTLMSMNFLLWGNYSMFWSKQVFSSTMFGTQPTPWVVYIQCFVVYRFTVLIFQRLRAYRYSPVLEWGNGNETSCQRGMVPITTREREHPLRFICHNLPLNARFILKVFAGRVPMDMTPLPVCKFKS